MSRHAAGKSRHTSPSSLPTRMIRSAFTLYLLAAVLYTAYHFVLKPPLAIIFPQAPSQTLSEEWTQVTPLDKKLAELGAKNATRAKGSSKGVFSSKGAKLQAGGPASAGVDKSASDSSSGDVAKGLSNAHAGGSAAKAVSHKAMPIIARPPKHAVDNTNWGADQIEWQHRDELAKSKLPSQQKAALTQDSTPMAEDFFLSKAFGEALQPSKVVPYYYKATKQPKSQDITITTLITSNRFKVFAALVERYQGPVSVTIHVTNNADRTALLEELHELYMGAPFVSEYVDVHLVIDNFERQFNMWRNVAKFFARTDYVMMLDVDFWICTDFRSRMLGSPAIMSKLAEGKAAFVVPAFEFTKQEDGLDASTFPSDKTDLLSLVEEGKIGMFHKAWEPGHGATNYTRYYESKPGEVYKAHGYTHSYEPYVIFKKEGTPYCDERFIGYGGNKAACLYELYLSGVSYYILPDDFVIHQSHAYAEKARQHERRYNRKLYTDFREELCFRYLNHFLDANELDSSKAKNLLIECKKIKGFSSAAQKLITASR